MKRFGEMIKRARQEKDWTLDRLARKAKTHKSYVSGIEKGSCSPPSAKLVRLLARALRFDERDLLIRAYIEKAPALIREELHRKVYPGE